VPMLLDGDDAQVSCVCIVNGHPSSFQIDSGSTFTQIVPSLAPERVPRYGLGFSSCMGKKLWFPTCEVALAPVDLKGYELTSGRVTASVQIGSSNLLGLRELRRWRVQLLFLPEAKCSAFPLPASQWEQESGHVHSTVPLAGALRAAEALSNGEISAEDVRSDTLPWLLDAAKAMAALHPAKPWWPMRTALPARPPAQPLSLARDFEVLFGTDDALVSHTMPLPRLT